MELELFNDLINWIDVIPEVFDLEGCEAYIDYLELLELEV